MTVKKEFRKLIKDSKIKFEIDSVGNLNKLTSAPKAFWKHLKKLTNPRKRSNEHVISPDVWIEHFSLLNRNNPSELIDSSPHIKSIIEQVDSKLQAHTNYCNTLDKQFSLNEIVTAIKRLKLGKASGCDAISNEIIKFASPKIANILCGIFNILLEIEHYPIQWATGLLMPLFKAGEVNDPNNYRGITINSCLSKLFTYMLNERLTNTCESKGIIHYNQLGFRKGFRTADQVFTLKTLTDQAFSKGKKLYTCFVDFSKAYDTVWREGLFYKLLNYGISTKFVKVLKDMYSRLQACIQLTSGISAPFPSLVGLKQGCNLSPILFNLFINELVDKLNANLTDAPKLGQVKVSCLLYADDLVLISESQSGLQKALDTLDSFTQDWHLKVNETKTKCLTFTRGRKPNLTPHWQLGTMPLQNCTSYCYLGTVFNVSGSLNLAADTLKDKAKSAMFSLLKSLYKHKTCNLDTFIYLFDKMVVPIASYNSEVWGISYIPNNKNFSTWLEFDNISKCPVESLHIQCMKIILGVKSRSSNWATLSEVGRYPIVLKVYTAVLKFLLHMQMSSSGILLAALKTNSELVGPNTWSKRVKNLLEFCNLDWDSFNTRHINPCKVLLNNKYNTVWACKRDSLVDSGKLQLYHSVKEQLKCENYLKTNNYSLRNAITKLRISAHNLPIETGRYTNTPREDRICPLCKVGVGNELHYLLECTNNNLVNNRNEILNKIKDDDPAFGDLNKAQPMKFILTRDTDQLKYTGLLCYKTLKIFKEELKVIECTKDPESNSNN